MAAQMDVSGIDAAIRSLKKSAQELSAVAGTCPAVIRNTARILASIKMLELNVCDIVDAEALDQ